MPVWGVSVFMYLNAHHPFECLHHIPLNRYSLRHGVSDQQLCFPNSCYCEQCAGEYCSRMFILFSIFLKINLRNGIWGSKYISVQFSSTPQSCLTLRPHELQRARPPCPSPTPGVHPNPCPSGRWCHPTISSSVVPFSFHFQSFPASGSFQMSQLFGSGGQSIGVSASTSVFPMNTQDWSPLGWTCWISLQSKGSQESSLTPQFKSINSLALNLLYSPILTSTRDYWKNHCFD